MHADTGTPAAGAAAYARPAAWNGEDDLALCVDTMVEGVHFPTGTSPADLAYKLLAVNLSDLAAMGAEPSHALVSVCSGERSEQWWASFVAALRDAGEAFSVAIHSLAFSDGPLTLTAELCGRVPRGAALLRGGARPGDQVMVTGTLGDAAAGLAVWRGELTPADADAAWLRARLDRPTPRLAAGRVLRGIASACIDVSDGLAADLGHVLAASGVGARIEAELLPLSGALLRALPRAEALELALAGGDDYELCFCVPRERQATLAARAPYLECALRCIGYIDDRPGLRCLGADGAPRQPRAGWMHFGAGD